MSRRQESRGRRRLTATEVDLGVVRQRCLLVGVATGDMEAAEHSLDELGLLVDTAGADPVARVLQRRESVDLATFVGKGKLSELERMAQAEDLDLVVVDGELSPAQQRNLESTLRVDVVDRVALILDIFAQHATSQEGMVQVELAQLRYRLPRLRGRGKTMSQQGAGIGTRGPGETQLEVDRRRILRRINKLERDLVALGRTRATQRKSRRRAGLARIALVGYTNAGKSTLLNRLTSSNVLVEDRLFSTLDPTTRRMRLPGGETALISDTVGFVQNLPHELVEAFRSTLDEAADVDLLVHVVDASATDLELHLGAVRSVLEEIGAADVPAVLVWNKVDRADPLAVKRLVADHRDSVAVSATTGEGLDELGALIARKLRSLEPPVELRIPYSRGDVLAAVHELGDVVVERHDGEGISVRVHLPIAVASRFADYRVTAQ